MSYVILAVLPLILVGTATPTDNFLCLKHQSGKGTQLISEKESSGRTECRESCRSTDQCHLAEFDSHTRTCALYTYKTNSPLNLSFKDTATVMIKNGLGGKQCDSSNSCYHGASDSYQGRVNQTVTGLKCQSWASQTPHRHTKYSSAQEFVDDVLPDNLCRNALGESYAPWCYTSDPDTRWDYCDVTACDKDCCHNDLQEEAMEALQLSLDSLNSEVDDKVKDIKDLQSQKTEMEGQLGHLNGDVSGQAKQISELQTSTSSNDKKMSSLESVVSSMQQHISGLQSAKSSQEKEIDGLQAAKAQTDNEINKLQAQVKSLSQQLSAPAQLSRTNCRWTNYVNNWDARLNWVAPGKAVIVGTESYHDNGKEDRLWKFYYCELTSVVSHR